MAIDSSRILRFLGSIQEDPEGRLYTCDSFDKLLISRRLAVTNPRPELARAYDSCRSAKTDADNLLTILLKLHWMQQALASGVLHESLWMHFAASDIDMWHIEIRSMFDHLASAIKKAAPAPSQVDSKDFFGLQQFAQASPNRAKVGVGIADLLAEVDWLEPIKGIRDATIHRGGWGITFPDKARVLFQRYEGAEGQVDADSFPPEVMYNENVVDFGIYAGIHTAYAFEWMDRLGDQFMKNLGLAPSIPMQHYHSGLEVLREWASASLAATGGGKATSSSA